MKILDNQILEGNYFEGHYGIFYFKSIVSKDEQPLNIWFILLTLVVLNEDKSIDLKEEQLLNIKLVLVNNFLNLNLTFISIGSLIIYLNANLIFLSFTYISIFSSNIFLFLFLASEYSLI